MSFEGHIVKRLVGMSKGSKRVELMYKELLKIRGTNFKWLITMPF